MWINRKEKGIRATSFSFLVIFNWKEMHTGAHSKCLAIPEGTSGCSLHRCARHYSPTGAHLYGTVTELWRLVRRQVSWSYLGLCSPPPKLRVSLQGTLLRSKEVSVQSMILMVGSNPYPWFHNPTVSRLCQAYDN